MIEKNVIDVRRLLVLTAKGVWKIGKRMCCLRLLGFVGSANLRDCGECVENIYPDYNIRHGVNSFHLL